jgi:hypothetical protein
MSNSCIADLDAKVLIVSLEHDASKLGPVVSGDSVWDPEHAGDGLDELDSRLLVDFDHRGRFRPLGEFVDGDVEIPEPSDGPGKWSQDVHPLHSESPCGWDHLQCLCQCMDVLGMELAHPASLYQLDSILDSCRRVKAMPKGCITQCGGICIFAALASMDLYEQFAALLQGYALH